MTEEESGTKELLSQTACGHCSLSEEEDDDKHFQNCNHAMCRYRATRTHCPYKIVALLANCHWPIHQEAVGWQNLVPISIYSPYLSGLDD